MRALRKIAAVGCFITILLLGIVVLLPLARALDSQSWTSDTDWRSGILDSNLVLQGTGDPAYLELRKTDRPDWMKMAPAVVPPNRDLYCLAWMGVDDTFLMFGGAGTSGVLGDTWKYSFVTDQWTELSLSVHPSNRSWLSCAYDPNEKVVVLFGGYTGAAWSTETWEFSAVTSTWSQISPSGDVPNHLGTSPMTYDESATKIVMVASNNVDFVMETWAYDAAANSWQNRNPSFFPSYRYGHAIKWVQSLQTFLFSGTDGSQMLCDWWSYDYYGNAWTNWACGASPHPVPRWGHAMAEVADCVGIVMVGGFDGTGYPPESWCFNNVLTWFTPSFTGTPGGRTNIQLADSPVDRAAVVFGGWNTGARKNDTWALAPGYVTNIDALWTSSDTPVDTGCTNPTYDRIWWNRTSNPVGTTMRFQIATSISPSGPWTFTGPGGLPGTHYTVPGSQIDPSINREYFRVLAKLKTANGRLTPKLEDLQVTWSCPAAPPKVKNTNPANGATNVPVFAAIWVNFTEPMNKSTVTWTIGGGIVATASWSNFDKTLKLTPTTPFRDCTQYSAQITGGKDKNDNLDLVAGTAPNPWNFTTICISPYIVTTDPPDGASGVPVDKVVVVTFSEPMNETTVSWTITGGITLSGGWNGNGDILSLSHATNFQACTWYTVEIPSGKDQQGLSLVAGPVPDRWTFLAACPNPVMMSTNPPNGTTNVALAAPILVTFSRAMNPFTVTYSITPAIASSTTWDSPANTTLTITHSASFSQLTQYTVEITAAQDTGGLPLVSGPVPNPWSFSTENANPFIVATTPPDGASVVSVGTAIVVQFSEPMAPASVSSALSPSTGFTMAWNADPPANTVLTLTPAVPLSECTQYTAEIRSGTDPQGLPLVSGPVPNPWNFRTECNLASPRGLHLVSVPPTAIVLSWQPVTHATAYNVYHASDRFAPFPSGWSLLGTSNQTQYTATGHLTDGLDHFYLVRATDGFQIGPNSSMGAKGSLSFVFNPAGTNINWFALPYNTSFARASEIANELGSGRIDLVGKWDSASQSSIVYYYARGAWRGTDFSIRAGDGLYLGIRASFTWSVVGTDAEASLAFVPNPPATGNVNWVGLPFTGIYTKASGIANELTSSKVVEIGLWDPASQSVLRWYWSGSLWTGTDFSIDSGAGVYLIIAGGFSWIPILVVPVQP